jgi:hypothetical protein
MKDSFMPIGVRMKVLSLSIIIVALMTSGCGMKRKLTRPPRPGQGSNPSVSPTPPPMLGGNFKVSAGSVVSVDSGVAMRATVGDSRQVSSAAGVAAHISVGPGKKNPHESQ